MTIYTADDIAGLLKIDYKTVLNLIKRGQLKALPGIRHKRITEEEFNRYLSSQSTVPAKPSSHAPAPPSARPAGMETVMDKSLVSPTAKEVASLSRSKPKAKT